MKRDYLALFDGALKANRIGSFSRDGVKIDIIRPGYDIQGRRRQFWTQFVIDGVPVYEARMKVELKAAMKKFDELWTQYIADDPEVLKLAIANCRKERLKKFRDGVSGESPAPSLAHDGRPDGFSYSA